MYQTRNIIVKKSWNDLYDYCKQSCEEAKLLRNSLIFRCRQIVSADGKEFEELQGLEKQVLDEFGLINDKKNGMKLYIPNYYRFERVLRDTNNPDFFNGLPMQTSQNMIKAVLFDFKSFFKAVKEYSKHPEKFTGKPKLPKYIKTSETSLDITNQDAVIKTGPLGSFLKLPKTKTVVPLGTMKTGKLKEVTIKPFYDTYKICIVMDVDDAVVTNGSSKRIIGIDLGVNNFAAVNNNCGLTPFIVNGKMLKSYNQWYNKELSKLRSYVMKENDTHCTSRRIKALNKKRYNKTTDFQNKAASYIIRYCIKHDIGIIVVGKNDGWKQDANMGNKNNQTFCFIAHAVFIKKLKTLAEANHIQFIETEESYTSKADLLSFDEMEKGVTFSGKRVKRGLYKSNTGSYINADINGAGNIIRKVCKDAFDGICMDYMMKAVIKVNI